MHADGSPCDLQAVTQQVERQVRLCALRLLLHKYNDRNDKPQTAVMWLLGLLSSFKSTVRTFHVVTKTVSAAALLISRKKTEKTEMQNILVVSDSAY